MKDIAKIKHGLFFPGHKNRKNEVKFLQNELDIARDFLKGCWDQEHAINNSENISILGVIADKGVAPSCVSGKLGYGTYNGKNPMARFTYGIFNDNGHDG